MLDKNKIYCLRANKNFIENMSTELLVKSITLNEVIPDTITNLISRYNPTFKKERYDFLDFHKDIINEMYRVRFVNGKILDSGDHNHHIYENIEFLKKHPEYKPVIDHIEIVESGAESRDSSVDISLDEFIEDIYYNPYLNEKKYVIE